MGGHSRTVIEEGGLRTDSLWLTQDRRLIAFSNRSIFSRVSEEVCILKALVHLPFFVELYLGI